MCVWLMTLLMARLNTGSAVISYLTERRGLVSAAAPPPHLSLSVLSSFLPIALFSFSQIELKIEKKRRSHLHLPEVEGVELFLHYFYFSLEISCCFSITLHPSISTPPSILPLIHPLNSRPAVSESFKAIGDRKALKPPCAAPLWAPSPPWASITLMRPFSH